MTMLHFVYLSMLSDAGSVEIPELLFDFAGKPGFSRCKDKEGKSCQCDPDLDGNAFGL